MGWRFIHNVSWFFRYMFHVLFIDPADASKAYEERGSKIKKKHTLIWIEQLKNAKVLRCAGSQCLEVNVKWNCRVRYQTSRHRNSNVKLTMNVVFDHNGVSALGLKTNNNTHRDRDKYKIRIFMWTCWHSCCKLPVASQSNVKWCIQVPWEYFSSFLFRIMLIENLWCVMTLKKYLETCGKGGVFKVFWCWVQFPSRRWLQITVRNSWIAFMCI